jgi:hypothetical protein
MLVADATFRSLTFRGLTWRKNDNVLPPCPGAEPNGADGVWVKSYDLRRVEAVNFEDCVFNNCHGAVVFNGPGSDLWGRLAHFGFLRCQVLNPYGSNTTDAQTAYGGGQQARMDRWVGEAVYTGCLFDGGSDNPDPVKNPGGIPKDGSHFGSPMRLVFTNNVVRHMGVEAVFQTDQPYMGSTASAFTVPPSDGTTTVQVALSPIPSTYQAGQILNFRTYLTSTSPAVNIYLTAVDYQPSNQLLTVVNNGLTPDVGGVVVSSAFIYLQDYHPERALIAGNIIDSGAVLGIRGITATAKATISGNFIRGYTAGVGQYENNENGLFPPTRYTVIDSNVILAPNPTNSGYYSYGVISCGPEDIISNNLIFTPTSTRFIGVSLMGADSWVEANTVIAQQVVRHGYGSNDRSVGIDIGNTSTGITSATNRTCGLDVGIGPDPYQWVPHRVLSHFSTNDVLAIDPQGLTGD